MNYDEYLSWTDFKKMPDAKEIVFEKANSSYGETCIR